MPGTPTSIALSVPEKMHAKIGSRDVLQTYVYDIYGNLTTLHGYELKITTDKPSLLTQNIVLREIDTGIYE